MKEITKEQVTKIVESVSEINKSGKLFWSNDKKLNKWLGQIAVRLLEMCDRYDESLRQIQCYVAEFPKATDYCIAEHGNLLVRPLDINYHRSACGYQEKYSEANDATIWDLYKRQVGYVARTLLTQKF